jgi:polyhydroxyalkanoate synthase
VAQWTIRSGEGLLVINPISAFEAPLRATVGAAAHAGGNAWAHFVGDGIEPYEPTPSEVVSEAPHATLRRYSAPDVEGEPILLVPPLAVSIACFDLRPGQSLAAFLVETGRPVYVVDYGQIGFADRTMGLESWIDEILPDALREVSKLHGDAPVDVVTWSLGGTLSFLTAASHPELPLRSIAALGTPIDYSKHGAMAFVQQASRITGGRVLTAVNRTVGGQPGWAVRLAFRATALQREVTKPLFVLSNLRNDEVLARMEAIDRFIATMPGYPGRLYSQMYNRLVARNELRKGTVHLGERAIVLAQVAQHVLIIAGSTDAIAPKDAVRAACEVLTGAASLRYEEVPGSHLGIVAGPQAPTHTWPLIADFLNRSTRP